MLKTGITTLEKACDPAAQRGFFGGTRKISITLYPEVCRTPNAEDRAEKILEQFMDSRRVFKRTYTQRFPDFDDRVIAIIRDHMQGPDLNLHDIAVSDGRTAVDFYAALSPLYPGLTYTASDYDPFLSIARWHDMALTFSDDGKILEICRPPFVFTRSAESRLFYPMNVLIRLYLEIVARRRARAYYDGTVVGERLQVFAPAAIKLAQDAQNFTLEKYDILTPFAQRYDLIRAMNIIDVGYFKPAELQRIAEHLRDGLRVGGLLVIGSNQDAGTLVRGGVYRRTEDGFAEIWRSGAGAAIHKYLC